MMRYYKYTRDFLAVHPSVRIGIFTFHNLFFGKFYMIGYRK